MSQSRVRAVVRDMGVGLDTTQPSGQPSLPWAAGDLMLTLYFASGGFLTLRASATEPTLQDELGSMTSVGAGSLTPASPTAKPSGAPSGRPSGSPSGKPSTSTSPAPSGLSTKPPVLGPRDDASKLKILAVHGGGYLASYSGRIDHAWGARSDVHGPS